MSPRDNLILGALPDDEYERVLARMHLVPLRVGDLVYEQDQRVGEVFFPMSGALSLLILLEDGTTMEPGIIGREGMLGFPIGLGDDISRWRSQVRIEGEAMAMPREALREQILEGGQLNGLLMHYAGLLIGLVAQSAACSQFHSLSQRCARWLLLLHDRAAGDEFPLTQESLASMVGSYRPSVSVALGELRDAGIIEQTRGRIRVIDRAGLERFTCECYERIHVKYDEIIEGSADGHRYGATHSHDA